MREQVITPRAGAKGRAGVAAQRPNARRAQAGAKGRGGASRGGFAAASVLKLVLAFVTARFAFIALSLLAVVFGLILYVGYSNAVSASFFKVKSVDVAGASRASSGDIREAVLRLSNAGAWQADLEVIAKELRELPWVRDAVVTRVLPDGLRVRVTEREPRVISRGSNGKLVWVDDDGVLLGAASPGEEDFFVRGLEESRTAEAVRHNRLRVGVARELTREWAQAGLTRRVSELNLEDLDDVRVQLAGQDAAVEVRLGREDFGKRFRQALEVLDAHRQTPRGPYIVGIDVSQGKRAVISTGPTAHYKPDAVAPAGAADAPDADGTAQPQATDAAAHGANAREAARPARPAPKEERKSAARPQAKPSEKKANARQPPAGTAATRPRRVG